MASYMFWIGPVRKVWCNSHYMSHNQCVWSTSSGVGERCWSLVKSSSFLWTADKQRHGSVRLVQTWFCESPLRYVTIILVVVLTYYWLNCRICRCRFVTLSKRPVQCLGQNGRHVTSRHGVGLDTQNVNKMAWKRPSWMSWIWLHSRLSRLDFFRVDAPVVVLVQKGPNSNPDLLGPEMQKKRMPQFEFQTKTLQTIKQVKHFKLQLRISNYLKLQEINFNSFQQISKGQDLRLAPETRCTGTPDSGFGFKSGFSFQYSAILGMSWIPNLLPQSGTKGIKLAALRSSRTWCSFASYLGSQPSLALTYLQHWH